MHIDLHRQLVSKSAIAAHEQAKHNLKCQFLCPGRFGSEAELQQHLEDCHVRCGLCGQWLENEFRLELHHELDHPVWYVVHHPLAACRSMLPSLSCGLQFSTALELKQHLYARVNQHCYTPKFSPDKFLDRTLHGGSPGKSTTWQASTAREHMESTSMDASYIASLSSGPRLVPQHKPGESHWVDPPQRYGC